MNLITKILISMAVVILVALAVASLLVDRSVTQATQGYLRAAYQQRLAELAQEAELLYRSTGSWEAVLEELSQAGQPPHAVRSRGRRGEAPGPPAGAGGPGMGSILLVDPESGQPLAGPAPGVDGKVDAQELTQGVPIRDAEGEVVALLVATGPGLGPSEEALLAQVQRAILVAAGVAGLIALLVGGLLTLSILGPLRRLQTGVHRIAQGDLTARVPVQSQDEVGQLATAFNRMAENLEQQEALRQRMVADIAHELRTPLSVIQGSLQAILDGVYPLEQGEIQGIYEETRLLSRLITDLHELAQAEAGQLPLVRQRLDVAQVLEQMASAFQPLAQAKGIQLTVTPPPAPLFVEADPERLQQILHNLLGNALHHVPPQGRVHLAARFLAGLGEGEAASWVGEPAAEVFREELLAQLRSATDDYANNTLFTVADNGPGMPPEVAAHVFDRFYRADASRSHSQEAGIITGAGLGLAISKALVELHGGRMGAVSQPGQGTVFWFALPGGAKSGPKVKPKPKEEA